MGRRAGVDGWSPGHTPVLMGQCSGTRSLRLSASRWPVAELQYLYDMQKIGTQYPYSPKNTNKNQHAQYRYHDGSVAFAHMPRFYERHLKVKSRLSKQQVKFLLFTLKQCCTPITGPADGNIDQKYSTGQV